MPLSLHRLHIVRILLVLGLGAGLLIADQASAQVYGGPGLQGGLGILTGAGGINSTSDIKTLILTIIAFLLDIVLLLAVLAIIVAGIYLIVSNGDEAQKDKAKKIIFYAIAGIILILFARVIVMFVNNIFG